MSAIASPNSKSLLSVTGVIEAATGSGLLAAPSMVIELLLGEAPGAPVGVTVSRVIGVAMLALGVACWLSRAEAARGAAKGLVAAMLLYNVGVVAVLALARTSLAPVSIAFWPVVVVHSGLAAWCVAVLRTRTRDVRQS